MGDLDQTLVAGTLLMIETGEYSDYSFNGPVRVLKDVTKRVLAEKFRAAEPLEDWLDAPEPYDFLPWLVKEGYAEAVDNVVSWHVGSYGEFTP